MKRTTFFLFAGLFVSAASWAQPVSEVFDLVSAVATQEHRIPVAVFDLDETLIDSTPRRYLAWREVRPDLPIRLEDIEGLSNRYDSVPILEKLGVVNIIDVRKNVTAMLNAYLSGRYLEFDREIPCASRFINELMDLGAGIVFISSRYESTQGKGTRQSLARLGFSENDRPAPRVILRPDGMESITFKKEAIRELVSMEADGRHKVVALFENEPENLHAWGNTFPRASAWFVDIAFVGPQGLKPGTRVIKNYCR